MKTPLSVSRPRTVIAACLLVALVVGLGVLDIRFETDLRSMIGDHSETTRAFFDLQDHGAANETLFVTVVSDEFDPVPHARELMTALAASPDVREVTSAPSPEVVAGFREYVTANLFLLLSPEALEEALVRLSPEGLDRAAAEARGLLESAAPLATRELLLADPFGLRELIRREETDRLPRIRDGILLSDDGTAALLLVAAHVPPTEGKGSRRFLASVRSVIDETATNRPAGVTVDLAGGYLYAEQEEARVRSDLYRTALPSLLAVLLLFWLFFRSLSGLVVVAGPVVLALLVTMGGVGWLGVRITPVTAAFCALLVGLGVDFGIHLIVSIDVEKQLGGRPAEAIARALRGVRRGIVLGGLTTAGAVSTLAIADLPGLASLGVLLAAGILAAMVGALTLSPALAMLFPGSARGLGGEPFARLGGRLDARRGVLTVITIVLVLVMGGTLFTAGLPALSTDPRELRPADDPPTDAIRRLHGRFSRLAMTDLLVWRGTDLDAGLSALADAHRALRDADRIRGWSGPDRILPPIARQRKNLETLAAYDRAGFSGRARDALLGHGINPVPFESAVNRLDDALSVTEPLPAAVLTEPGIEPIASRFLVDTGGDYMLVAYLSSGVGGLPPIRETLTRAGLPVLLTGPRAMLAAMEDRVESEFRMIPLFVLAAVFAATIVGFRSLAQAAWAVTPVVLGTAFTLCLMRWFGLGFNIVNVGLIPMILGLGVDDGIQFVNRLRYEGERPIGETYRHAGGAILLTTLTTGVAFGSLVISTSPGLQSMGALVTIGAFSCCAATLLLLPGVMPRKGPTT